MQGFIDSGVYAPDYVYYYDFNGDGVLTQEDHTLMTQIWQSGIWPLWAYEWNNQFAPPDLEVPEAPKVNDIRAKKLDIGTTAPTKGKRLPESYTSPIFEEEKKKKGPLNKIMRDSGGNKKFKVYVKDPSTGNIKTVRFGDPNMEIKRDDPERRKNFRARHNCDNPGPKTKARYWSCKQWRAGSKVED